MSFLKKHWRFTVPAVVVLCVLLLAVVALHSTSEPSEPNTVYAMPERSVDNPLAPNTGGIAALETIPSAETTVAPESPANEFASDTESLESCCPEESAHVSDNAALSSEDNVVHVSPEAISDAQRHREWDRAFEENLKHHKIIDEKIETWTRNVNSVTDAFYATLSPADRASLREGLPEEARQWWPTLFDDETPARTPDPTMSLRRKALLAENDALLKQIKDVPTLPEPPAPHAGKNE